jgi:phosphoribosylformylglycinamidine synthase
MESVKDFASNGGRVLGICNGFQILCEAGLLPGVLLENVGRRFLSQFVHIKTEKSVGFFTSGIEPGKVITCPIAHFQGNYYADEATLKEIEANGQVVFRYSDTQGNIAPDDRSSNVNGSCHAIAGIANKAGNVVGLMPHPERAAEALVGFVGGDTGLAPFRVAVAA